MTEEERLLNEALLMGIKNHPPDCGENWDIPEFRAGVQKGIELAVKEIDAKLDAWIDNTKLLGLTNFSDGIEHIVGCMESLRKYLRDKTIFPWSPLVEQPDDGTD